MHTGDFKQTGHGKGPTQWIYGLNPVLEAIRAGRNIRAVYLYSGRRGSTGALREEAGARGIPVKSVSDVSFFDGRFPKGHQGVAAEAAGRPYAALEELLRLPAKKGEAPFFLILDLVEDPRNLGGILRSAEASGVHGVVIQKRRAAGLSPEAAKASAGASEYLPVAAVANIKHAMEEMKKLGIFVAGAEAGSGVAPWEADLTGPIALVVGSEGAGLRRTVRQRCDLLLSLPLMGRVNSLNTSVAAGVLLYEILRQRLRKSGNR
jgi:23S rRNA (guanosine2251-2'-O)-methyltransferase